MKFLFSIIIFLNGYVLAEELITPIPQSIPYNKEKAKLGKKLFFDTILSHDRTVSCETCHHLKNKITGADSMSLSKGIYGKLGDFNSPTVLNAVFNYVQFWNGRVDTLKEQTQGPLHNPKEMGMTKKLLILRLNGDEDYKKAFDKLYTDGVNVQNVADAIAEFEKTLITPNSRFDKYLQGDEKALSAQEKKGYKTFKSLGCIACHNGVNIGGNLIQHFGIFSSEDIPELKSRHYYISNEDRETYYYKVPSLRNISKTAPYFHDGKVYDLKEAIDTMIHFQLGREVSKEKKESIYKFLLTLDGQTPSFLQ